MTGPDAGDSEPDAATVPGPTPQPPRRRLRRPPAVPTILALLLVVFGLVLALSAWEVASTRVSLNVSAETVSFVTEAPALTGQILLRDLAWNSSEVEVVLPDGETLRTDYFQLPGHPVALPPLRLPEGAEVTVWATGVDGRVSLLVSNGGSELALALPPGALIDLGEEEARVAEGLDPVLRVLGVTGWFHVTGTATRRERIAESIPVSSVSFWREAAGRQGSPILSTVRQGLLVLEDVGGRRIELREGEPLALGRIEGVLRSAALEQGLVNIQLDGRARDVRSGYTDSARSLMPSRLDRLMGIPEVKAMLAVIAVLLGSSIPFGRRDGSRRVASESEPVRYDNEA